MYLEHLVNLKGTILKFFRKIFLKYVSKLDGYLNSINSNGKNVIGSAERFSKKARKRNKTSLKKPVRGVHFSKEHKSHLKPKKKPKEEIQTKDMDQKASP